MDDGNTGAAAHAELMPNGSDGNSQTLSTALEKVDASDVPTVFAQVEGAITRLPDTVAALKMRDGLRAVEAAAKALSRHDIRRAAARIVAKVEQWIAKNNPPRPVGRPRKPEGDENAGRPPTFSEGEGCVGGAWERGVERGGARDPARASGPRG